MGMDDNWWVTNLKALESRPQRLEALTAMNTTIAREAALPRQTIERLLTTAGLYDCANPAADSHAPKDQAVDVTLELLCHCLDQLTMDTADEQLPSLLRRGLTHSNPALRAQVLASLLKELRRQLTAGQVRTLPNNELIFLILDELKQPDTEGTSVAINILSIVLTQRISDPDVQAKLVQLLKQNEIVRCCAYELAVVLAKKSATLLNAVTFILDAALSELDNDDVLLQASVMELLVPLVEQNHGLSYMERRRILDLLSLRVQLIEERPLDALLIPSIMKFFGKIAVYQPLKIIGGYPHMLGCLFVQLLSEDESILPTAMDTLANLATSPQGKILLNMHFSAAMEKSFERYGSHIKKLSAHIKERLLNSLDVIYDFKTPPAKEINTILKNWYECFARGAHANTIMDLINTPFPDLQMAALALLKTICKYNWGIVALKNTGGAVEFLLSRQKDLHRDIKYMKWQIMEILSASAEFSPTETIRFTAYVNEGPYHVQADLDVATEPQGNA
ncbi:26S proteasome non-ATPase regulatory subunit 5 [Drosophila sechellia]|nr:26S proteasome non-ATPase regulatory subunit 5 [Drosophila sechellia]